MVNGVRRRLAHHFSFGTVRVGEWATFQIEAEIPGTNLRDVPCVELVAIFLFKTNSIGVGHVFDQIDFPGPQGRQPNPVFLLGASNDLVQIWQGIALIICFPPVLITLHNRLVVLFPGYELKRPGPNRMVICVRRAIGRHELNWVIRQAGNENPTWVIQMATDREIIDNFHPINVFDTRASKGMTNFRVLDSIKIPFY